MNETQDLPEGWLMYSDEYSRTFYYNSISNTSTWTKPRYPAFIIDCDGNAELHASIIEQQRQRLVHYEKLVAL